jgi:hypothetical protein
LKKRIDNISSFIEGWCKKNSFARPLLPFGTVIARKNRPKESNQRNLLNL